MMSEIDDRHQPPRKRARSDGDEVSMDDDACDGIFDGLMVREFDGNVALMTNSFLSYIRRKKQSLGEEQQVPTIQQIWEQHSNTSCRDVYREILLDNDFLLTSIFQFLGPDHYRFVGGVNRRFRAVYSEYQTVLNRRFCTSHESMVESIPRAQVYMNDMQEMNQHRWNWDSYMEEPDQEQEVQDHDSRQVNLHNPAVDYNGSLLTETYEEITLKVLRDACARYGNWKLLLWLVRQKNCPLHDAKGCTEAAVKMGRLKVLKWLVWNGCPLYEERGCLCAAKHGRLQVLKWLVSRLLSTGYHDDRKKCIFAAAKGGHLHVLEWLVSKGYPADALFCPYAAEQGHLHVIQWAKGMWGLRWDDASTCSMAAKGDHLHLIQWARSNGCRWDEWTCSMAAKGGHLEVLQWARTNGCPWNSWTCSMAAKGGHLEVLKWARTNGCPWDEDVRLYAEEHGHLDVLRWAQDNGCP